MITQKHIHLALPEDLNPLISRDFILDSGPDNMYRLTNGYGWITLNKAQAEWIWLALEQINNGIEELKRRQGSDRLLPT